MSASRFQVSVAGLKRCAAQTSEHDPHSQLHSVEIGVQPRESEEAGARAAYQDFLTLWKEADSDIPILIAAKSEYSKLQ